jgi:hypothetical protein
MLFCLFFVDSKGKKGATKEVSSLFKFEKDYMNVLTGCGSH